MKNTILYPLIAFILLCGCKSNSFMTQRYTKLGHAPYKASPHKQSVARSYHVKPQLPGLENAETKAEPPILSADASSSMDASIEKTTLKKQSTLFFPNQVINPLVQTGKKSFSKLTEDFKKAQQESLSPKKTFKEKVQRAAALFDTLFKIVLWCIILAVLVAIIIIIILT